MLQESSIIDISHEALIRQWKRLREWVADEYANATEYRRWRDRAEAHFHHGSALLTGTDLSRASEWWFGLANQPVTIADSGTPRWRPLARWAERYEAPELESDAVRYPKVFDFIVASSAVRMISGRSARSAPKPGFSSA